MGWLEVRVQKEEGELAVFSPLIKASHIDSVE